MLPNSRVLGFIAAAVLALLPAAPQAVAGCNGANLIDQLPPEKRARLDARLEGAPFAEGNLWLAEKPGSTIHVAGTMHLPDPRHEKLLDRLAPAIEGADRVMLEATMEDMNSVQSELAENPGLLFIQAGPSLIDLMAGDDWERLKSELSARGIPGFIAAKMQPWYAGMLLNIPPCAMGEISTEGGLDHRIAEIAGRAGVPTMRLEDPGEVLERMAAAPLQEQLDALLLAISQARFAEDGYATMLDSYFSGRHREIWEFYRMQAAERSGKDPQRWAEIYERFEKNLLSGRNRSWMEVLLPAARRGRTVVAVGAAHLSGETGILQLLEDAGYSLTRLD